MAKTTQKDKSDRSKWVCVCGHLWSMTKVCPLCSHTCTTMITLRRMAVVR